MPQEVAEAKDWIWGRNRAECLYGCWKSLMPLENVQKTYHKPCHTVDYHTSNHQKLRQTLVQQQKNVLKSAVARFECCPLSWVSFKSCLLVGTSWRWSRDCCITEVEDTIPAVEVMPGHSPGIHCSDWQNCPVGGCVIWLNWFASAVWQIYVSFSEEKN